MSADLESPDLWQAFCNWEGLCGRARASFTESWCPSNVSVSVSDFMFAEDQSTEKGGILVDQTVLVLYLHFPLCFN